ncbi:MAG: hypothetical protein E7663_04335 [Ruminococcaceae bacterium]|nr:hypothetical protein [Oscillospiraceae bacterium]
MKRWIAALLLAVLCLSSCQRPAEFTQSEQGFVSTDTETGISYRALDLCFQAVATDRVVGVYSDPHADYDRTYFAVSGQDTALFLVDDEGGVWYAGADTISPESWELSMIGVCEEESISVEIRRFEKGSDDALIGDIRALWFSGEAVSLPSGAPILRRGIRFATAAYNGIFYCFDYLVFSDGSAYFYELLSGRAVSVPAELAERLPAPQAEGER